MKAGIVQFVIALAALAAPATPQDARVLAERERLDLLAQKRIVLIERHLQNAAVLEERLDLEGAERELLGAREIDPTNRIVAGYLREIQALLGRPEAEAASLRSSAVERAEARRQQMRMQAQQDLLDAEAALAEGDAELALLLARTVQNQVDYSTELVDWDDSGARARDLQQRAEASRLAGGDERRRQQESEAYRRLQEEEHASLRQQEERTHALLTAATDRFLEEDYDAAQELAQAVLEEDQHHPEAIELLEAARDASREDASQDFLDARREQFRRWRETMEEVRIPYNDVLQEPDPEHWAAITAERAGNRSLGIPEPSAEEQALRAKLQSARMDADFQELTITQAANNIFFSTDVPVSVDPEVVTELDDAGAFVNLAGLRNLKVASLLDLLVEQTGEDLAWTIRNGRVYITKAEKAAGQPLARIHNIQDLTFPLTDFKGTDIKDIPLPGEAGDDSETTIFNSELERKRLIEPDEIENLVRENIARESWDSSDVYSIGFVDSTNLLVIHTAEVQQEIAAFLDSLRSYSTSMVTLESRFIALSDAFVEEIGTDLRGLGPDGNLGDESVLDDVDDPNATQGLDNSGSGTSNPAAGIFFDDQGDQIYSGTSELFFGNPLGKMLSTVGGAAFQFTILDDTQLNFVLRAVQKSQNAFQVTAPTVSVFNTQRAFVTVVNQVSFVQGFDVDVANAARIADPIIGVVQEGMVLDVRPTISYDRKYVTLDVQTTVADLLSLDLFETNVGSDIGGSVQFRLPTLDVRDARTTVVVPDGGSVVLGGFKNVLYKNRTAEVPWMAQIPLLGFLFRNKGLSDEMSDLIILIRATVTDYSGLESAAVARNG